jgi:hypothetical protein
VKNENDQTEWRGSYDCSLHPKMTAHIVVARAWGIRR